LAAHVSSIHNWAGLADAGGTMGSAGALSSAERKEPIAMPHFPMQAMCTILKAYSSDFYGRKASLGQDERQLDTSRPRHCLT
jgi:hypothetical protein